MECQVNHVLHTLKCQLTKFKAQVLSPGASLSVSRHLHDCRCLNPAAYPRLDKVRRKVSRPRPTSYPAPPQRQGPAPPTPPSRSLLFLKGSLLVHLMVGVAGWEQPPFPGSLRECPQSRRSIVPPFAMFSTFSEHFPQNDLVFAPETGRNVLFFALEQLYVFQESYSETSL